jgi:hypothetical protein
MNIFNGRHLLEEYRTGEKEVMLIVMKQRMVDSNNLAQLKDSFI